MTTKAPALPESALLDTSAVVAAFWPSPTDNDAEHCFDLVDRMVKDGRRLMIAAPTLAEVLTKDASRAPLLEAFEFVAFDPDAARVLATKFPKELLLVHKQKHGGIPLGYFRYDAMILACAIRHLAHCVVSCDEGQRKRAEAAGLKAYAPSELARPKELLFPFAAPTP